MENNPEIAKLKQKKRIAKASFTRAENFLRTVEPDRVKVDEVNLRLKKLEEAWKAIEESLTELAIFEAFSEEQVDQELVEQEERYIELRLFGERLVRDRVRPAFAENNLNQAVDVLENQRIRNNDNQVKLPKIELPVFSGKYEDWHSFYNTFQSLIHSNQSINEIQKFHYLISSVKGEAAETIASLEISEANYRDAWFRLKERYDIERFAVQNHIKAIFELPTLKKENSITLRSILDGILKHIRALAALKRPTSQWDDLLIYVITSKLDYITTKEWESHVDAQRLPTFQELIEFLTKRCQMLEAVARRNPSMPKVDNSRSASQDRLKQVKALRLCLNCLKGKHMAKDCYAGGCKKCAKRHSTLLHEVRESSKEDKTEKNSLCVTQQVNQDKSVDTINACSQVVESVGAYQVLLSTAIVKVKDHTGHYKEGRALLDSGSQSSFITEEFAKALKLKTVDEKVMIKGINQIASKSTKTVNLKIASRFGTFERDLSCIVLPKITQNLPTVSISTTALEIPRNIKLADPSFNVSNKIDLLIGAESFWELICIGQIKLGVKGPILQKSLVGWLVTGPIGEVKSNKRVQTQCNLSTMAALNETMNKFWETENYKGSVATNDEESYVEGHFLETYKRQPDGRFIVQLPIKEEGIELLEDSRKVALRRLLALERKFERRPEFKTEYVKFMREYAQLGHMKRIENHDSDKLRVFLPHHAVQNEDSKTTKTRVVFDASSRYAKGRSLNDALYKGPVVQTDLFELIVRFRAYKYVLCADIKKMYRQILVNKEQTRLQSILWREEVNSEVEEYELLTLTYGTKPASFLATRCLKQLAELEKSDYPRAAEIVNRDFYMDDLITGGNSESEIRELKGEVTELLARGGFELHKWNSNILINKLSQTEDEAVSLSKEQESRLLGVLWNPCKDTIYYKVSLNDNEARVTKRAMLAQICRLFDPLGLVGPVIVSAKLLMQELWSLGVDWDESVPMHIQKAWEKIRSQLCMLNSLNIVRKVISGDKNCQVEIHGFCDASEKAYGACIYIREQNERGEVTVSLLCAKSRVAPIKALSLPRLELCGAVLLVDLMEKIIKCLDLKMQKRFYWTDSSIVMAWLGSPAKKWQVFVANRVSNIHDKSSISEWRHVRSKENPADVISRGTMPKQLMQLKLWWEGPQWLKENESLWPKEREELSAEQIPERKRQAVIALAKIDEAFIEYQRFSSFNKLLRALAYVIRFSRNLKSKKEERERGPITVIEVNKAKLAIVKLTQEEVFQEDLRELKSGKIHRRSKLAALHPFLDSQGILRVGGRLRHALIDEERKHPILLPAIHHVTTLIIVHHHERLFHAGAQTTLNSVREEFWPIFAKSRVKKVIRNCVTCRKANPKPSWQLMGELPSVRVNINRPFLCSGVDYCGPFHVRDRVRRNSKKYKAYVAIFVCMTTKAVHIELVEDMTTEAFLGALKRFTARRGKVQEIYSDNGTNFVGADRALQQILEAEEFKNTVQEFATSERIEWHFIPPRSPHQGGLWEAAVRSMKLHLKRTLGDVSLTVGEMFTVLAQVEAILNSRPITALSEDPNDLRALTPGHFLIGESPQAYPERNLEEVPANRLSRWQHVEKIRQQLWKRWQGEYLSTCQQRSKWNSENSTKFQVGQLVMLKESESMPLKWTLARITEVHPGADKIVRTVTVRTRKGVYKRAIVNISPIFED
ncbi:uncharacterized protein LOC118645955 [Monomorium pharaonis]|uniref:uncharacterized protein LOC118645955 n=1 Tax=Monomorium pharaonis TaxID=307658 RepID=UPI001746DAF2|nr:uncharacterized protein LOC118645955 [Monomorium pharaonis]